MTMQSVLAYMGRIKVAADGEMPHTMLPGRTSKTTRSDGPTTRPSAERAVAPSPEEPEVVTAKPKTVPKAKPDPKKKKKPVLLPVTPVIPAGAPKVDINFSVKLGSADQPTKFETLRKLAEIGHQINTGAFPPVSTSMAPSVTGGLGELNLPNEDDMMETPMVQGGSDGISMDEILGSEGKVSSYSMDELAKYYTEYKAPPTPQLDDGLKGEAIGAAGGGLLGGGAGLAAAKLMKLRGAKGILPALGGAGLGAVLGAGAGTKVERNQIADRNAANKDAYVNEAVSAIQAQLARQRQQQ